MAKKKNQYVVRESNHSLSLDEIPTQSKAQYDSDQDYDQKLKKFHAMLEDYQTLLYAGHSRGMLIIFQGMDTSGKDGAIKHVMSGVNPQGCVVHSFKAPTSDELNHDFLWRCLKLMPSKGQIGIFNRSYYEEALITRVHPEILESERLPKEQTKDPKFWKHRYDDIVNHEKYLHRQGYEVVKIFLHISKEEQKKRLLERLENPKKIWKFSEGDIHERKYWDEYQKAYEQCIRHTASKSCPWYLIPGDDKKNARLNISSILVSRFKEMRLRLPELTREEKSELAHFKAELADS